MDDFTKVIPIKFDVKEASLRDAEAKIDNFTKQFQDGMSFDGLKEELASAFETKAMIAQVDELIAELEGLHGAEIDAFRESLEAYKSQLNPVKSVTELLQTQYELHKQIVDLQDEEGSVIDLSTLEQMNDELENQISLMGTDGQLAILEERRRIEEEILTLSTLDTDEAREKIVVLEEQMRWLEKTYSFAKEEEKKPDTKDKAFDLTKSGVESFGTMFEVAGDEFSDMTTNFGTVLSGFQKGFLGGLLAIGTVFIASLSKTLKDGAEAAKELLGANRMSNSNTRETMFEWGTTKAGAYGVNQAMEIMGYSSQEDFTMADEAEKQKFLALQEEFAKKYIDMQETGLFDKLLDSQIEMAKFEKEIEMQEAEFYMENQDAIMNIKRTTLKIQEFFVKLLGWLFNEPQYTRELPSSTTSDVLQTYSSTTNNNRTTNVSIDNSFNNQTASDQASVENSLQQMLNVVDAAIS